MLHAYVEVSWNYLVKIKMKMVLTEGVSSSFSSGNFVRQRQRHYFLKCS